MAPELYQIQHAARADELLAALARFVTYVKSGPVFGLLPNAVQAISARDASEVAEWEYRIARVMRETLPLNATARFWLSEIDQVFKAARARLDELTQSEGEAAAKGTTLH
jgi:hypothetical protein